MPIEPSEFSHLASVLKDSIGRGRAYYFANPGNWGDSLIREGTLQFLRDSEIAFKEIATRNKFHWIWPIVRGGTLIFGGGGAWCKHWNFSEGSVRKAAKRFRVIVLPSTYETHYSIPNTHFFRRDDYESKLAMPNSRFGHDMAFYLQRQLPTVDATAKTGYFFRCDKESSGELHIPAGNVDISAEGKHLTSARLFIESIAAYEEVHSDRLHVAIAAAMMQREVHFYPGAYFKNLAVYRSSLKDFYSNVTFHSRA